MKDYKDECLVDLLLMELVVFAVTGVIQLDFFNFVV